MTMQISCLESMTFAWARWIVPVWLGHWGGFSNVVEQLAGDFITTVTKVAWGFSIQSFFHIKTPLSLHTKCQLLSSDFSQNCNVFKLKSMKVHILSATQEKGFALTANARSGGTIQTWKMQDIITGVFDPRAACGPLTGFQRPTRISFLGP
jgi:hypothetical protein